VNELRHMNYSYFDIHSHLTEKRFSDTRDDIAREMLEKNIGTISIGVDQAESRAAVDFARKHENVYASIGQHPVDNKAEEFDVDFYQDHTKMLMRTWTRLRYWTRSKKNTMVRFVQTSTSLQKARR